MAPGLPPTSARTTSPGATHSPSLPAPFPPDPKLFKGAGPLHRAAGAGSAGVVRRLLRAGADPNVPGESGPPLFWAAGSKHADVVALLLRAGADPNKLSQQGMTPLAMAAAIGGWVGHRV